MAKRILVRKYGTLTEVVAYMMTLPGADSVLLSDGENTWSLASLYDMLQEKKDDGRDYYWEHGFILQQRHDGRIDDVLYWPADLDDDLPNID